MVYMWVNSEVKFKTDSFVICFFFLLFSPRFGWKLKGNLLVRDTCCIIPNTLAIHTHDHNLKPGIIGGFTISHNKFRSAYIKQ